MANPSQNGYTLIELLLVMAIIVIIAGAITTLPIGQKLSIEIEEEANKMVSILRTAQSNATTGERGAVWGVYINNTGTPFYELFYGATYASGISTEHVALPSGIIFEEPPEGTDTTIQFNTLTGNVIGGAITTIRIADTAGNHTHTVTVTPIGLVTKN